MVFWSVADLLAWVCAGAGDPWALRLLGPAGPRGDQSQWLCPALTPSFSVAPWEAPQLQTAILSSGQ